MTQFSIKEYDRRINEIFNRFPSVQKVGFDDAYKPGIQHMIDFEALLGDPHKSYRTIHVAGTNGKGSVANMLASALSAAGLRVGLYTSPHIVDFRERMRIVGPGIERPELVSREYVFDFLENHSQEMERLDLSFFEITTGMAFKWFADQKVDLAVIEVGLGGRLDSTNLITPDLAIVTSIGMDHCSLLGDTLEAIAGEKAGIFKKDVPALVGEYLPETRPVFEGKAKDFCPLTFAQDVTPSLWFRAPAMLKAMDLRGKYQEHNLRTVLAAIDILMEMPFYQGLKDSDVIVKAISTTARRMEFHGRWERISSSPFIIADIGHNPPALKENFAQLQDMLASGECSSLIMVYAVMADKALDDILPLMPENATYIFTAPSISRAMPVETLYKTYIEFCRKNGRSTSRAYSADTVRDALMMAVMLARQTDPRAWNPKASRPLVYVGGSSYLVSEAIPVLTSFQGIK